MRAIRYILIAFAAVLAAPQALACHPFGPGFDQPAPFVFWKEAPQLLPGEVAISVEFDRMSRQQDPVWFDESRVRNRGEPGIENIVIITCFANPNFRIASVLAGEPPDSERVMLYAHGLNTRVFMGPKPILVGQLMPLASTQRDGSPAPADSPRWMLLPRLPPQGTAGANDCTDTSKRRGACIISAAAWPAPD